MEIARIERGKKTKQKLSVDPTHYIIIIYKRVISIHTIYEQEPTNNNQTTVLSI